MKIQIQGVYHRKTPIIKIAISILLFFTIIVILVLWYHNTNITKTIREQPEGMQEIILDDLTQQDTIYLPQLTEEGKENLKRIYTSDTKIAYLTFDDGPSKDVTPLILDLLKEKNIKATFFMLGTKVKTYPEVVKRAYEEGHYIANHGYYHKYDKLYQNAQTVLDEYNKTEEAIREAIGVEEYCSHLFRFPGGSVGPYGSVKKEAITLLEKNNIAYLDWNALTKDSEGQYSREQLLANLKKTCKGKKSVVILSHDASGKILTYEVLKDIISYLEEEGYGFGDMRDLVK